MIEISVKTFEELSKIELYDLLKLRCDVFIFEQESICDDVDGQDPEALHILAKDGEQLVGCVRLLPSPEKQEVTLGRVVTAATHRGQGIARQMIELSLQTCANNFPGWALSTAAQKHLESFYQQFGFVTVGDEFTYPKDHIVHVLMRRL